LGCYIFNGNPETIGQLEGTNGEGKKGGTVTLQELLVTSLAQTDAVAKLLIEKGVLTQDEFMEKIKAERVTYQAMLHGRVKNE